MIQYPNIDPVLLSIGPLKIRWYGLSYLLGVFSAFVFLTPILKKKFNFTTDDSLNLATAYVMGIIFGGRLGYVLFYDFIYFLHHPFEIVAIWQGGMSYHGGGIGAVVAMFVFSKRMNISFVELLDLLGIGTCFGVFFGRIANFINGELFGRVSDISWAMIFPGGGPLPRHPSQLYESFFEGFLLFWILYFCMTRLSLKKGQLFSLYLLLYGLFRFFLEFTREPDEHLGFVLNFMTMGQVLSSIMIILGGSLFFYFRKTSELDLTY
jgi:phosphatidylglycerol---prolipoprotein diacylglyceryl transferase